MSPEAKEKEEPTGNWCNEYALTAWGVVAGDTPNPRKNSHKHAEEQGIPKEGARRESKNPTGSNA